MWVTNTWIVLPAPAVQYPILAIEVIIKESKASGFFFDIVIVLIILIFTSNYHT